MADYYNWIVWACLIVGVSALFGACAWVTQAGCQQHNEMSSHSNPKWCSK